MRMQPDEALRHVLTWIQNDLFDAGADLATPGDDFTPGEMVLRIVPGQVDWLEERIDALNDALPPLTSFILPGGSALAAVRFQTVTVWPDLRRLLAMGAPMVPVPRNPIFMVRPL